MRTRKRTHVMLIFRAQVSSSLSHLEVARIRVKPQEVNSDNYLTLITTCYNLSLDGVHISRTMTILHFSLDGLQMPHGNTRLQTSSSFTCHCKICNCISLGGLSPEITAFRTECYGLFCSLTCSSSKLCCHLSEVSDLQIISSQTY